MPLINTKPTARVVKPPKGIVYSMPGVGKSTFAAQSAAPYVLDCENGLSTVYVHKTNETVPSSGYLDKWENIQQYLAAFESEAHDRKTLVIDTLDWMIRRAEEHVSGDSLASTLNKSHGGYGNGKQVLRNYVYRVILPTLDRLVAKGVGVVLLAHCSRSTHMDADGIEIEKLAPDLPPDLLPTFMEWSDFIGFAHIDGKGKRMMTMRETDRAIAKSRYRGMPDTIPLEWDALAYYINEAYSLKTEKKDTV